jgi:hypothetical protein
MLDCFSYSTRAAQMLEVDQVMTLQEMRDTGIASLSPAQRQAFDAWLNRYTLRIIKATSKSEPTPSFSGRSSCSPTIESTISGEIEGWDGETIFKLENGQIWQQAEYDYTYFYAYRPDVTIYPTNTGCRMKVEDEEETVLAKRIK